MIIFIPVKSIVFYSFRLHRGWWHLVSLVDLPRIILANACSSFAACVCALLLVGPPFPKSIFVIDGVLCLLAVFGIQFCVRAYKEILGTRSHGVGKDKAVLIYGAGSAGLTLAKEIRSNRSIHNKVLGFLDDDAEKLHRSLLG